MFAKYPELKTISWTQYTPYFNDGDPCTFRANTEYPDINDEDIPYADKNRTPMQNEVVELLETFDGEELQQMFGDHVRITMTKAGTEIDSYDHD